MPTADNDTPAPNGLPCPHCGRTAWRVLITRRGRNKVMRIRRCQGCGQTVRTAEKLECSRHHTRIGAVVTSAN